MLLLLGSQLVGPALADQIRSDLHILEPHLTKLNI